MHLNYVGPVLFSFILNSPEGPPLGDGGGGVCNNPWLNGSNIIVYWKSRQHFFVAVEGDCALCVAERQRCRYREYCEGGWNGI